MFKTDKRDFDKFESQTEENFIELWSALRGLQITNGILFQQLKDKWKFTHKVGDKFKTRISKQIGYDTPTPVYRGGCRPTYCQPKKKHLCQVEVVSRRLKNDGDRFIEEYEVVEVGDTEIHQYKVVVGGE